MAKIVRPSARALFLCDRFIRYRSGKSDVIGIFTRARAEAYPHVHIQLSVFCELTGGWGRVPFSIQIIAAESGELVYATPTRYLNFSDRLTTVQVVNTLQMVPFRQAGVYFVELWCDNEFMADVRLTMEPLENEP